MSTRAIEKLTAHQGVQTECESATELLLSAINPLHFPAYLSRHSQAAQIAYIARIQWQISRIAHFSNTPQMISCPPEWLPASKL